MMTPSPVTIRPAFPDELGRARTLLNGVHAPAQATFLVAVKELPVERLVAAIPWWKARHGEHDETLCFQMQTASGCPADLLAHVIPQLESAAHAQGLQTLLTDFPLPEAHPLFQQLVELGFAIADTETLHSIPGETFKAQIRSRYEQEQATLPASWSVVSIRGQDPKALHQLIAGTGSLSPQRFQAFWDASNRERFEEAHSCVLLDGESLIGTLLVSRPTPETLYLRAEAIASGQAEAPALLALRHHLASSCADGFPATLTTASAAGLPAADSATTLHHLRKPIARP